MGSSLDVPSWAQPCRLPQTFPFFPRQELSSPKVHFPFFQHSCPQNKAVEGASYLPPYTCCALLFFFLYLVSDFQNPDL